MVAQVGLDRERKPAQIIQSLQVGRGDTRLGERLAVEGNPLLNPLQGGPQTFQLQPAQAVAVQKILQVEVFAHRLLLLGGVDGNDRIPRPAFAKKSPAAGKNCRV